MLSKGKAKTCIFTVVDDVLGLLSNDAVGLLSNVPVCMYVIG